MNLPGRWLDRAEAFLESLATKTVLSVVILVSVFPPAVLAAVLPAFVASRATPIFLSIFVPEFLLRLLLFDRRRRRRRLQKGEILLLFLDLLATVSFLPVIADARYLRFFRLARMLLLLGYWRGVAREFGVLLTRRERRFQILLVLILSLLLTLAGGVVLIELDLEHDFDGNGKIDDNDRGIFHILWWTFRQIQDPGNLVPVIGNGPLVAISLALTFAGVLLFSFLIGIGTTLVGELIERSRSRQVGMHGHTVVLGLTSYSTILLRGLAEIYRKNLRPFQAAILADAAAPDVLGQGIFRGFHYRRGSPIRTSDLDRVDMGEAKRVLLLGDDSTDPDAMVISMILATRDRNPDVDIYPDLEHERNFPAARAAGGANTHVVGSGSLLGYYLAQNVAYPGIYKLYRQLLQPEGCEIYTYLMPEDQRRRFRRGSVSRGDSGLEPVVLHHQAQARGITLLGFFTAEDPDAHFEVEDLDLLIHPIRQRENPEPGYAFDEAGSIRREAVRGFVAVAVRFSDLTAFTDFVIDHPSAASPEKASQVIPVVTPSSFDELRLEPDRGNVERVLILGLSLRAPRVIRELVELFRGVEITVLARENDAFEATIHDVRSMLAAAFDRDPEWDGSVPLGSKGGRDSEEGAIRLRLADATSGVDARISFTAADWTHQHLFQGIGAVTLETADVILLLLGSDRTADIDGSIALDCLHLANLGKSGAVKFKPGAHVLAMIRDPDKGRLLESRLHAAHKGPGVPRFTVIARESARHRFMMQCVFVHGMNAVYLSLLGSNGRFLSRLVPAAVVEGSFEPRELADHLLFQEDMILIGIERRDPSSGDEEVVVDPRAWRDGKAVPWADVGALYVLAEGGDRPS